MNIVHLEGRITGLYRLMERDKGPQIIYKYRPKRNNYEQQIEELSLKMEPKELLQKLAQAL